MSGSHRYTKVRAWSAEGARVGAVTCQRCGAALLIDPADDFDVLLKHDEWHDLVKLRSDQ